MSISNRVFDVARTMSVTGKATARVFAERGASLVLVGADQSKLDV